MEKQTRGTLKMNPKHNMSEIQVLKNRLSIAERKANKLKNMLALQQRSSNKCVNVRTYIREGLRFVLASGYITQSIGFQDFGMRPIDALQRAYYIVEQLRKTWQQQHTPRRPSMLPVGMRKAGDTFAKYYKSTIKAANATNAMSSSSTIQKAIFGEAILYTMQTQAIQLKESFVMFVAATKNNNNVEWRRDTKKAVATLNVMQTIVMLMSLLVVGVTLFSGGMKTSEMIDVSTLFTLSNWWHELSRVVLSRLIQLNKTNVAKLENGKRMLCY